MHALRSRLELLCFRPQNFAKIDTVGYVSKNVHKNKKNKNYYNLLTRITGNRHVAAYLNGLITLFSEMMLFGVEFVRLFVSCLSNRGGLKIISQKRKPGGLLVVAISPHIEIKYSFRSAYIKFRARTALFPVLWNCVASDPSTKTAVNATIVAST